MIELTRKIARNIRMLLRDNLAGRRTALAAIAARHGASNLRLFGSVVRGEEQADSDVDLLVDIAPDRGWTDYLAKGRSGDRAEPQSPLPALHRG